MGSEDPIVAAVHASEAGDHEQAVAILRAAGLLYGTVEVAAAGEHPYFELVRQAETTVGRRLVLIWCRRCAAAPVSPGDRTRFVADVVDSAHGALLRGHGPGEFHPSLKSPRIAGDPVSRQLLRWLVERPPMLDYHPHDLRVACRGDRHAFELDGDAVRRAVAEARRTGRPQRIAQ